MHLQIKVDGDRVFELLQLKDVMLAEHVFKLTCLKTHIQVCVCLCVCTHAGLGCAIAFGLLSTSSDKRTKRAKSLRIGPHSEHRFL